MPQFTAGSSHIAENRRNYMDRNYTLEKLRDIEEEDVVRLLAHRAPGEEYKSIHPPLEEMEEPECAVREMVEPTEGAKAGDRIRYVRFIDSMQFAPITPRQRAWSAYNRYRGVDIGVSSGSTIIEARERDIEKISKELIDGETFDTARTGLRGRTVGGHAIRLDENGMMFDALRRWAMDERTGEVSYGKDMIGGVMDKEVVLGKPLPEDELHKRTTMYRWNPGREGFWQEVDDPESMDVTAWIHWKRTVGGFQPWKKMEEIKGGKKDVGVKDLKLFFPIRGVVSKKEVLKEGCRQWGNIPDLTDKFERTRYLFSWDSVPGDDDEKFKGFLKDDFDIGWAENAEIIKSDNGKIIRIFKDENLAEIIIDEKKEKASLKVSDGRTLELKVKKENGELNIYQTRNLKPEEMLSLLESKRYAIEKEKEDMGWGQHHTTINRVEKKYYKDIPPIPGELGSVLQDKEEKLSKEEAEKLLKDFMTIVEDLKLGERGEKNFIRLLEELLISD